MTKKIAHQLEAVIPRLVPLSLDKYVDREEQISKFTDVLDRIKRQAPVPSNLFEWYGSPGIGKSVLVRLLANKADEKKSAWSVVNFREQKKKINMYLQDPIVLIEEIASDLRKHPGFNAKEFDKALKSYRSVVLPDKGVVLTYAGMDQETRLYKRPKWLNDLRNVVIEFIKLINTSPTKSDNVYPVTLFFDETEYADIELVDWIEEWVINPLIQVKHCVVVWTARRPWRWKRPEIRRRLTSEQLTVFALEMVREQIESGSTKPDLVKDLFKNVYSLTGGHPFASSIVINQLDSLARHGESLTPETFADFESQILTEVFDKFINKYAFRDLGSSDLKIACQFVALVRLFDTTMLKEVLRACTGDSFKGKKQEDFGELLLQLKKTQLLVWEKGYALDPGLRHIIQKYFMASEKKTFIVANKAALRVYQDWLDRPVDNRGLFVVEELYHNAALLHVGAKKDSEVAAKELSSILDKRLQDYPNRFTDEVALENALDYLEGELQNDKELGQYIPSVAELATQVQKFRAASPLLNRSKK
jgi:hypothetical protein